MNSEIWARLGGLSIRIYSVSGNSQPSSLWFKQKAIINLKHILLTPTRESAAAVGWLQVVLNHLLKPVTRDVGLSFRPSLILQLAPPCGHTVAVFNSRGCQHPPCHTPTLIPPFQSQRSKETSSLEGPGFRGLMDSKDNMHTMLLAVSKTEWPASKILGGMRFLPNIFKPLGWEWWRYLEKADTSAVE